MFESRGVCTRAGHLSCRQISAYFHIIRSTGMQADLTRIKAEMMWDYWPYPHMGTLVIPLPGPLICLAWPGLLMAVLKLPGSGQKLYHAN